MNKIIVANFKMNLTNSEINNYLDILKNKNMKNIIFCPSSIYLSRFIENGYDTGIQDISSYESGAHTGEVSASQVSSIGVKYAIIGHSEIKDSKDLINKKINLSLKNNIKPIVCIGEDKSENINSIYDLIDKYLDNIDIKKVIIAYEPIWSIGTNATRTLQEIDSIILQIKNYIKQNYNISDIITLYGGSVNKENFKNILYLPNIDGVLIGNASLNAVEFLEMIEVAM